MGNRLFETEDLRRLKSASEIDDSTLKRIRKEYFKKTFEIPFIGVLIAVAVTALWVTELIPTLFGPSDFYDVAILILVPLCDGCSAFLACSCIL